MPSLPLSRQSSCTGASATAEMSDNFCLCVTYSMHSLQVAAEGNAARRILADGMVAPAPAPAVMSASGMAAVVDTAHQTGIASANGMASVAATVTKAMAGSVKGPIILMHGAIQGGEVWEFPRLPEAPGVSAPLLL